MEPRNNSSISLGEEASRDTKRHVKKIKLDDCSEINFKNVKYAVTKQLIQDLNNQTFFKNKDGKYPSLLYTALDNGDIKLIKFLVDQGVDLNVIEPDRNPFFFEFIGSKKTGTNVSLAKKLINAGADVNKSGTYESSICTPLTMSLTNVDEKMALLLIKNGANIHSPCSGKLCYMYGCSPLSRAIEFRMHNLFKLLIRKKIDVNLPICSKNFLPLHKAISQRFPRVVDYLVSLGADINAVCPCSGESPLHLAMQFNLLDSVQLLLKNVSINVNIQELNLNSTPLFWMKDYNLKCLEFLLNANPDVNVVNKKNKLAVERDYPATKKTLIKIKNHLVKLRVAGFYLCDRNLAAVTGQEYDNLYAECCKEVDFMKKTAISPSSHLNFQDILFMSELQLALCLESSNDQEISPSGFDSKFPLYAGMIEYKLDKAVQWIRLRESLTTVVYDLFNNHLPSTIMEMIFSYFTINELMKLQRIQKNIISKKNKKHKIVSKYDFYSCIDGT